MLIVRLEAWTPDRQGLGELLIRNDGTGHEGIGHYHVTLVSEPDGPARNVRQARVEHYPRALGAWHLVQCALLALGIPPQRQDEALTLDLDPDVQREDAPLDSTHALLAQQQAAFPGVQAQAQRLYAAYVAGLGPLGVGLPPWQDLIDRQQYAWRCVARAQGEGQA